MVEVVPIHTLSIIVLGKVSKIIENHKPIFIYKSCTRASKRTEVIYKNALSHKLSFIHIESGSKNIYIHSSVKSRVNNKNLFRLRSVSSYTVCVISIRHKLKLVGITLKLFNNLFKRNFGVINIPFRNANKLHLSFISSVNNELFHINILVYFAASIKAINNLCDKVVYTLYRKKSLTKLLVGDSSFIEVLNIELMEDSSNIRNFTLEHFFLCNSRVELVGFCNLNEYFLDSFTIFKSSFLEHFEGVSIGFRGNDNSCNPIYESTKELILRRLIRQHSITNFLNVIFSRFGDSFLIGNRSIRSNSVQYIYCRRIKHRSCGNSRH